MKGLVIFTIAGTRGLLAFLGLVGGTLGYGLKSFFGYLHTKDKYHLNLTRSLYYQNLDNNAGVIFRILDEAELQEFAETLLAYAILWRCDRPEGLTPDELDRRAETLLLRTVQDDAAGGDDRGAAPAPAGAAAGRDRGRPADLERCRPHPRHRRAGDPGQYRQGLPPRRAHGRRRLRAAAVARARA